MLGRFSNLTCMINRGIKLSGWYSRLGRTSAEPEMRHMLRAILIILALISAGNAYAQGSAGTGSTSTGIGPRTGPAGPGFRSGGWTQQPVAATNNSQTNSQTNSHLSPSQKNAIPPPKVRGYQK